MTTVAPGNREPLPLEALRAAGVRVGLGQDGIRDYWSPYGNGDMLERAYQLAYRAGLRKDDDDRGVRRPRVAWREIGVRRRARGRPANIVDDDQTGLAVGAVADLVIVPAETVTAAVMDHPPRTAVIHDGRVVARERRAQLDGRDQALRILAFCAANSSSVRIPCSLSAARSLSCWIASGDMPPAAGAGAGAVRIDDFRLRFGGLRLRRVLLVLVAPDAAGDNGCGARDDCGASHGTGDRSATKHVTVSL